MEEKQNTNKSGSSTSPQKKQRMYPELIIPNNTHPNKLYAFPLIGLLIKLIMVIPVGVVAVFVGFVYFILWLILPFVILFKGTYWNTAYKWTIGYLTYIAKIQLFLTGITDKYPGFNLETNGVFEMRLPKPETPSRLLGFPVLGVFIRIIITIPYAIYSNILGYGMYVAMIASWFGVWIKGSYPESLYEFIKDELRVSLAYSAYTSYLSDTYPSFKISMNHKAVKIILLILGIILFLCNFSSSFMNDMQSQSHYNYSNSSDYNNYGN